MAVKVALGAPDLRHTVLAVLSLAAQEGQTSTPIVSFFRAFADLADQFRDALPALVFSRTAHSAYSKRLDSALQSWVGYTVGLPNPVLRNLELRPDAAARHLAWLEERYGGEYVERLRPIARKFVSIVSETRA